MKVTKTSQNAVAKGGAASRFRSGLPVFLIQPSHGWVFHRIRELWEYPELLYFLTWRDIKVRYKQTVMGAAWAIIQPFFTMVVLTTIWGR